jgi:G8 domain
MRLFIVLIGLLFSLSSCKSAATLEQHDHLSSTALPHNIPNFCANPTVSAKQNGDWSNTQTWTKVLVNNDVLEIPAGRSVVLDIQSNTRIKCLAVKGTLRFRNTANTRLRVGTLMILVRWQARGWHTFSTHSIWLYGRNHYQQSSH